MKIFLQCVLVLLAHGVMFASPGACHARDNVHNTTVSSYKDFTVADSLLTHDLQLVRLIVNTPSMNNRERQEMFDLLATASRRSREKLRNILLEEQAGLGNSELPALTKNNTDVEPENLLNDLAALINAMGRNREERMAAIRPFLQNDEDEITVAAIQALGELADKDSAGRIQTLAVDGQPRVRVAALYALERIDRGKLLEVLYRAGHDDNPLVSFAAESIDRQLAKEFTRDDLLALVKGRDMPMAQWAVSALRKYHTLEPGDISLLATFLEGAPPELQQDIFVTLLHSGQESVMPVLQRISPETAVAVLLSANLEKINIQTARKAWLERDDIADALVEAVRRDQFTQSHHRLFSMLQALALLRVEKSVPLLVEMFLNEDRRRIDRENIFRCLETFDKEHVQEELQNKMTGAGKEAKEWIAGALKNLGET